ncbi:MAG: RHS repeat-associated core domain-containing protein, partial [Bacillota bacterium]
LNQMTYKTSDSNGSEYYTYEYDSRGNLLKENLTKAGKVSVEGSYVYNEMNRLSVGTNNIGETSTYVYNGLGYLVQNVWEIKKNAYGYQEIQPTAVVAGEVVVDTATGKKDSKEKKSAEVVLADPELNKTTTVTKDFVLDYTRNLQDVLYETETGNLNYRYGYGLQRLSATISPIDSGAGAIVENGAVKLYYHQDYLGTTDYLTSDATGKVVSWTMYNEWGEITHNAVLKCGQRELDLVKNYTGYEYDPVLGQYYAKNRMYDAENRRFTQLDPAMDDDNWYAYVGNNPVNYVDPLGLEGKPYFSPTNLANYMDSLGKGTPIYSKNGTLLYVMRLELLDMYEHDLGDYYYKGFTKYVYTTLGKFQERKYVPSKLDRFYIEEPNTEMYVRFYLDARDSQIDPVFKMRLAAFARDFGVIIYSWDGLRDPGDKNYSRGSAHTYGMAIDAYSFVRPDSDYFKNVSCEQQKKDREYEKAHKTISDKEFLNIDMANTVANQTTLLKYGLCKPWNNKNPYPDGTKDGQLEGWHLQPIETIPESERNTSAEGGMKYPTAHTSDNLNPFYQAYTGGKSRL